MKTTRCKFQRTRRRARRFARRGLVHLAQPSRCTISVAELARLIFADAPRTPGEWSFDDAPF